MSSPAYALPLRIERRASRGLAWAVGAVHGLALAVLPPLDLPWWLKLIVAAAVLSQAVLTWRRHVAPRAPGAIRGLLWRADGQWELMRVDGRAFTARLRRASYLHPHLVILRFIAEDGARHALLLPADAVDAQLHRRLRVGLRLQAEPL